MPRNATSSSTTASTSPICSARSMSPKTSSVTPSNGTQWAPSNVSASAMLVLPAMAPTRRPRRSRCRRDRVSRAHDDRLVEDGVRPRVEEAALALGRDRRSAPDAVALAVGQRPGEVGPLAEDPAQLEPERLGHGARRVRLVAVAGAVGLGPEQRRRRHVRAAERQRARASTGLIRHAAGAKWLSM